MWAGGTTLVRPFHMRFLTWCQHHSHVLFSSEQPGPPSPVFRCNHLAPPRGRPRPAAATPDFPPAAVRCVPTPCTNPSKKADDETHMLKKTHVSCVCKGHRACRTGLSVTCDINFCCFTLSDTHVVRNFVHCMLSPKLKSCFFSPAVLLFQSLFRNCLSGPR